MRRLDLVMTRRNAQLAEVGDKKITANSHKPINDINCANRAGKLTVNMRCQQVLLIAAPDKNILSLRRCTY